MTERIDHAAEALGWRELVNDQYESGCPDHEKVVEYSTIMQASATLALVEQQRIANEIALRQATFGLHPTGTVSTINDTSTVERFVAALGIEEVQS